MFFINSFHPFIPSFENISYTQKTILGTEEMAVNKTD